MNVRFLSAQEVRQALPMAEAIAGMKAAYAELSTGQAVAPLRAHLGIPEHGGTTLIMPAYLRQASALAVKIVSVFPRNAARGEPVIYGLVFVLDASSGRPLAILEGGALTAIRTGAASGAATDLLARSDARIAALIGSGAQAHTQLEAICTVRPIQEVRLYGINREQARQFAAEMAGRGPIPPNIRLTETPEEAVQGADVICTATSSARPVFNGRSLSPGAHVNAIGAYLPSMREVDTETVRRSLVVVDARTAVLAEAGDLVIPIQRGEIEASHIYAELGEIVAGLKPGRTSPQQITFFKSVGLAVQDAIAAQIALRNAEAANLGIEIAL